MKKIMLRTILLFTFLSALSSLTFLSSFQVLADPPEELLLYQDQKHSFIDWEKVNPSEWGNYKLWLLEHQKKIKDPLWLEKQRDRNYHEKMGVVLACVGECRLYRGDDFSFLEYNSPLREEDTIETLKNSYLWVYLLDGSILRLAPYTSVTLREFNVGTESNFLYARCNFGLIYWQSRRPYLLPENNLPETDLSFLPLEVFEANFYHFLPYTDDQPLAVQLAPNSPFQAHRVKLNETIVHNNSLSNGKISEVFMVLPNATVHAVNPHFSAFVQLGRPSYFKTYSAKKYFTESDQVIEMPTNLYLRGYNNKEIQQVDSDQWYEVNAAGNAITAFEKGDFIFRFAELVTKRITSILLAREIMLQKWSLPYLTGKGNPKAVSASDMLTLYGHKLWTDEPQKADPKSALDYNTTVKYLVEYTRRSETTLLNSILKRMRPSSTEVAKDAEAEDPSPESAAEPEFVLGKRFYKMALNNYYHLVSYDKGMTPLRNYRYQHQLQKHFAQIKSKARAKEKAELKAKQYAEENFSEVESL